MQRRSHGCPEPAGDRFSQCERRDVVTRAPGFRPLTSAVPTQRMDVGIGLDSAARNKRALTQLCELFLQSIQISERFIARLGR
jgi:hypothetical protein